MSSRRSHGEGSVHRRNRDGKWVATLELPNGPGGKRQRKTFLASTEREARQRLRAAQRELEQGRDLTGIKRTLEDFLSYWLESEVTPSDRSQSTKVGHEMNVRRHIVPEIGHLKLTKVDVLAVRQMLASMEKKGLSARTRQYAHTTLRSALRHAVDTGMLDRNAAAHVRAPRPTRDPERVHSLTPDAVARIFEHTRGQPLHALWVLLVTTGVRKGEALALRWDDVDFEGVTITVARSLYRHAGAGLDFKEVKTQNSHRTIPLAQSTLEALRCHRHEQVTDRLAAGGAWEDHGLVFCGPLGRPLDLKKPNIELRKICTELGLPPERVHNLRHTAATIGGLVAGGDMHVVSRQLGHASITTTIDMYRHSVTDAQRSLADGIAEVLAAPSRRHQVE